MFSLKLIGFDFPFPSPHLYPDDAAAPGSDRRGELLHCWRRAEDPGTLGADDGRSAVEKREIRSIIVKNMINMIKDNQKVEIRL